MSAAVDGARCRKPGVVEPLLARLAEICITRPRSILGVFAVLLAIGAIYGRDVTTRLSPAGYDVSGSESTEALAVLAETFGTGPANIVVLASTGGDTSIDSTEATRAGIQLGQRLEDLESVNDVTSYWLTGASQFRNDEGTRALLTARIVAAEDELFERAEKVREALAGTAGPLTVVVGGSAIANLEIVEESERDLLRAELIAIPLTTIIMLFVFRSVVAALLPLVVSAVAIIGTATALKGLSETTLVSIFALNLTTALGLGMGVDFSLFTISRWREERATGATPDDALRIAVARAGRSILFSGLTTAATLAALLLFDYPLIRSLAIAGFAVVLLAMAGSLVALPAAMALLGDRVDLWRVRSPRVNPGRDGFFHRTALQVMKRPGRTIFTTTALLLLLGTPFLRAQFAIPDDRALPPSSGAREVADTIRSDFDDRQFGAMAAVLPNLPSSSQVITDYALALSSIEGVAQVETSTGIYREGSFIGESPTPERFAADEARWLSVVPAVEPISPQAEQVVADIRAVPAPANVLTGGESARLVDNKQEISSKLWMVGLWVTVTVGALLYSSFGSVLLPAKALMLNLLSLTAAFGAIVWIFQDGRLTSILGFTPTGLTDAQTPVLVFCIAFGLSMDYEVFLLSRIKEEWDRTGDLEFSVATGLQRTGGIITAAAALMAVVFLSFATGNVTFIQMVGIGLALSIIVDALVVRTLLVPAFMAVAGSWNWWPGRRRSRSAAAGGCRDRLPAEESPVIQINKEMQI